MNATMEVMAEPRSSFREATRDLLREKAFEAARGKLGTGPWSQITMNEIAVEAGVSRQTLYNEFGNRNQFGIALVMHEAARFLGGVDAAIRARADNPRAAVEDALGHFLRAAGEDPMVAMLLSDDGTGGMLPFVTTQGMPVVAWVTERITSVITETWPASSREDSALIAETLVRLAISYVTTPAEDRDDVPGAIGRLLGPFIDQALAAAR